MTIITFDTIILNVYVYSGLSTHQQSHNVEMKIDCRNSLRISHPCAGVSSLSTLMILLTFENDFVNKNL